MTATQIKTARRAALRTLKVGDTVRVVRIGHNYAGPGTAEVVGTAGVIKVLARSIRVMWAEDSTAASTDFTTDSGKPVGERRWINYPMVEAIEGPTLSGLVIS
jgi:hypothetical protein